MKGKALSGAAEPYKFRRAWSSGSRGEASKRVQTALESVGGLLSVTEALGEAFAEIMVASAVSVSLLDDDGYWDLVTVGNLGPGEVRFPNERYPTSYYPFAAERLLAREGYISTDGQLYIGEDHPHFENWAGVGSFMGVPVIANAEPRGQMLIVRDRSHPAFLPEDLQVATDLATHFGARLPNLLAEYKPD